MTGHSETTENQQVAMANELYAAWLRKVAPFAWETCGGAERSGYSLAGGENLLKRFFKSWGRRTARRCHRGPLIRSRMPRKPPSRWDRATAVVFQGGAARRGASDRQPSKHSWIFST